MLLLPMMLLRPHQRGKCGIREIKATHNRFLHFHWKELLYLHNSKPLVKSGVRKGDLCAVDGQCKASLRSIKSDELS